MKDSELLMLGEKLAKNLFKLNIRVIPPIDDLCISIATLSTLHERLGHFHLSAIKHLASNNLVEGLNFDGSTSVFFGEPCELGKDHKLPHDQKEQPRSFQPEGNDTHRSHWSYTCAVHWR